MAAPDTPSDWIDHPRFMKTLAAAKNQFTLLKQKHPGMKAWLVISSPAGQTNLDNDPVTMLGELPRLFHHNPATTAIPSIARDLDRAKASKREQESGRLKKLKPKEKLAIERGLAQLADRIASLEAQIGPLVSSLMFDGNFLIEIRFRELDYDLLRKLRNDPLTDRGLTPQTGASIRIVLGTISGFAPPADHG